jgi:hypothetical protein
VIVDTVSVRYYKDEDGYVRFTTAGGGQRITDERLQEFNTTYLGIPKEAVTKQQFDLDKLRELCFRRFVDRLYMVRFSDPSGKEYRSIDHALFQSRQYIDPAAERLKEVRADKQAKIESFDSDIQVRPPQLAGQVQVRFFIRGMSGAMRLRFPKLTYARESATPEAQAEVFYAVVNATVDSILDADYYAEHQDSLQDLDDETGVFPEMANLSRFSKVLSTNKNREEFFQKLDVGAPRGEWLPHLRAIDGLLSSGKVQDHVRGLVAEITTRSPSTVVKILLECRPDPTMNRIGRVVAAVLTDKLQVLAPDVRLQAEEALLAWSVDHEDDAWDVEPDAGEITLGNLRWRMADLSLDVFVAVLRKLISILHGRLVAASGDLGPLLDRFNWCMVAARSLPTTHSRLSPALRLVAENRVPTSVADGSKVLKATPSDLPTLDDAVLQDFGLPLWPSFEAVREGGQIMVRNTGVGVALALKAMPSGTLFSNVEASDDCDLRPGEDVAISASGNPTRIQVRFKKYGAERGVEVPVVKAPSGKDGAGTSSETDADRYGWVRQAELVRALHRVLGEEDSPDKGTLTRAVQDGQILSNGESGRKCRLQVDSIRAWLNKTRNIALNEVQQVVDALISEIRMRKQ